MDITLTKEACREVGIENLKQFGFTEDNLRWKNGLTISLSNYTKAQTLKLRQVLAASESVKGVRPRIADVDVWLKVLENPGKVVRCRKVRDFAPMLKQYLKCAPKQWLYERRDSAPGTEVWQPYYVSHIAYHPPQKRDGYTTPAFVNVSFAWEEMGEVKTSHETFYAEHCEDYTVPQALAEKGYLVEDSEKLATYEANTAYYKRIFDKVGLQFLAVGEARTSVDTEDEERRSYWYHRDSSTLRMDRDGVAGRVVIDVLNESGKDSNKKVKTVSGSFWGEEACDLEGEEGDTDEVIEPGDEDEEQNEKYTPVVPLMPAVPIFDLKRHKRLKIYVDQLTLYEYDTSMATKLVLPADVRGLVDMLVAHKGGFRDIVGGKGTGAIVLCCGQPGTGKTLTSEVYSESMQRPLYSVQCSQLGTDPDELEKSLLKVFARSVRWNAILLLDEADVYVARRGSDLQQNAIVGVFLRVLEYYGGVMFLTTNRADLVDDAIASRCLARLEYKIPTPKDQAEIWRVLADTAGIPIEPSEVAKVVEKHPKLSGRDVKNLLKLAWMVSQARGLDYVNAKMVDYVRQFKPTEDLV